LGGLFSLNGGTLPLYSHFHEILGVYSLNFAFALEDENFHSPNEFFRLDSFRRGQRAYVMLMEKLAERGL
jgi:acetylornithine deacetylase/succinyl-diaminopimelate desuccinylase-like protein